MSTTTLPTTAVPNSGRTGSILTSDTTGSTKTATAPYGQALVELARTNPNVVGLTADLGKYTDMALFSKEFPERYFQIGMAEQNLVGVSCGLARTGYIPFATTYCVFATRRAYDFIAIGAALGRTNIKLIAGLPGLTTGYGGTHQGIEDLALMRSIPNLVVIDPCDATEIAQVVPAIAAYDGPVYMRLLRGEVPVSLDPETYKFELGKAKLLKDGDDVAIISTGLMTGRALQSIEALEQEGIKVSLLHVSTLKPFDSDAVEALLRRVPRVITAENHMVTGGLGSAVADLIVNREIPGIKMKRIGIPDCFCDSGSIPYLIKRYNLDPESISAAARSLARP